MYAVKYNFGRKLHIFSKIMQSLLFFESDPHFVLLSQHNRGIITVQSLKRGFTVCFVQKNRQIILCHLVRLYLE